MAPTFPVDYKTMSTHRFNPQPSKALISVHRLRLFVFCSILALAPTLQAEPVRVFEETAIPYMSFLSKADFDQRYPGETLEDPAQLEAGWYVIYQHQTLNYYFGPILLQSIGEDYLAQLTETVEAAVAERPSIEDFRLELSYEPQTSSSETEEAPTPSIPTQSEPKSSFWGMLKKAFGFG
jgi:hypothetical protein